jgi:hypothetical protein
MSIESKRTALWAAVIAALATATTANAADSSSSGAEWKPLFNGRNLDGWQHVGPGEVVVENGTLKTVGGMGLLWYTGEKIGNAVIKVVYRAPSDNDGGNSGVFIRIPEEPTEPWMPVNRGYEVQIDDTEDDWHRTGVLYSFTKTLAQPKVGEWNTMEITLDGERTIVTVNGTKVTDYREGEPVPEKKQKYEPDRGKRAASGYIGVQNHGDKDTVYFKEISVKKLK